MLPTAVPVSPDHKAHKARQDLQAQQDLKDQLVQQVLLALQVQPDHKVPKDRQEQPVLQGPKGRQEPSPTAMQPVK